MMQDSLLVGIDIGGTKINCSRVAGDQVAQSRVLSNTFKHSAEKLLEKIFAAVREVWTPDIKAVGIGMPGTVDLTTGMAHEIKNIPLLSGFPIREAFESEFKVPVYVNNDANCFALGEYRFGCAQGMQNVVALTLGTGLGAGLILNGKLYSGSQGGAGEFGTLGYRNKTLEHFCSSEFFREEYGLEAIQVFHNAQRGEEQALDIFSAYGYHLAEAIRIAASIINPDGIVLGGSVAHAYPFFEPGIQENLRNYPLRRLVDNLKIMVGQLEDSAVLGAAALYYDDNQ